MAIEEEYEDYRHYKGNPNLKREGENVEWDAEKIKEYARCQQDPVYFIETYVRIIGDGGLQNFKLYPYQKKMIKSFVENRNTIVTTARQAGKSTTTVAFILWYILFTPEKTVGLLANKGDTAREILGRLQLAYQHLPKWLQQGVKEWNKGNIYLENESRVLASATSGSAIRGYTLDLLFIDEAAHIENWEEFFTSVYPTISSKSESKIILVSTPFGLNHFHATWDNAWKGKNNYNPILVNWREVPGRDDDWKEDILKGMNFDIERFNQEMECEFLGSSGTLIAGWKLKELTSNNPLIINEGLRMYKKPQPGHIYVVVCDVSRGKGLDYSAFQMIDVTTMPYEQVAVYKNNAITPLDYANIIYNTAKNYNNAFVLVEINDIGEQVSQSIHYDFGYEYVMYTENAGRSGKRVTSGFAGKGADAGVRTTKIVKAVGCSMFKLLVEQNQLILNDHDTIEEIKTFSKKGKSYEAEKGCNDDLVMSLVLFGWLSDQQYFKEITNIDTLNKLRDKTSDEIEEDLTPFGFVDDGMDTVVHENHERFVESDWIMDNDDTYRDF